MKKLTALICIVSMLCTMALSAGATASPSKTPAGMREADIFDALDTLKHLVGIVKLPTALYDFKNEGDVTINSTLTVLEGLVGVSDPIILPQRLKPLAEETELEIKSFFVSQFPCDVDDVKIDYFGTYNDAVSFQPFIKGMGVPAKDAWTETVAGYKFKYNQVAFTVCVWKNGIFSYLASGAYENSDLTQQDVRSIHHYYALANPQEYKAQKSEPPVPPLPKLPTLTEEMRLTIKNDFVEWVPNFSTNKLRTENPHSYAVLGTSLERLNGSLRGIEESDVLDSSYSGIYSFSVDDIVIDKEYYGTYGDSAVVVVKSNRKLTNIYGEQVTPTATLLWNNGDFMLPWIAVETGFMTQEEYDEFMEVMNTIWGRNGS